MTSNNQSPGRKVGVSRNQLGGLLSRMAVPKRQAQTPILNAQLNDWHVTALKLHREGASGEVSVVPRQPQTPDKLLSSQDGTALANLGVVAVSPQHAPRGGARNHGDRESFELTVAQVGNLINAARHADAIGLPLNRMITIHWEAADLPLNAMAGATGRFIDLMTKALVRHGSKTSWIWVHEGGHTKGGHCHLLVHIPADLVPIVTRLQKRWLRTITGRPYRARVIHSVPIGGRLGMEVSNRALYLMNLATSLAYVLKGASHDAASRYGLTRLERGGYIIGKRCGTSQNIGMKSRNDAATTLYTDKLSGSHGPHSALNCEWPKEPGTV